MSPRTLLARWLAEQLPIEARTWLETWDARVQSSGREVDLYVAVSLAARKVGKADLELSDADLREARTSRPGWDPRTWSLDQAARVLLVLALQDDPARLARYLEQLCNTADVSELAAFYRGLPLYPDQPRYVARATEGLRTNMKNVFEAIAHRNPYPSEQFSEAAWNQMVLKTLFVGSPLWPIVGLDRRGNPKLARMLCEYAHERWSAGRAVSPELWRCVGPHASGSMLSDLDRVLINGTERERLAVALSLRGVSEPAAKLLHANPGLVAASRGLSWERLVDVA